MLRRRKRLDLVLPTASMGDIAFLLIIFFMLASNFMKTANVETKNPDSPDVETQDAAQVSVILDVNGKLWLQGAEIGQNELSDAVQAAVGDHRERPVHVRIDRNLLRAQYLPVIEALSEAGVRLVLVGDKK